MKNEHAPGVLFILNSLVAGGAEKHVLSLIDYLPTEQFRLSLTYLKNDHTLLPQVQRSRLQSLWCGDVRSKLDWQAVSFIAQQLDTLQIDIIVCTNQYSALYGWLARMRCARKVRLVEVFHTTKLLTRKDKLQMLVYKPIFRQFDLLIYVCGNQQRYWQTNGLSAHSEAVIYNGIDTNYFVDSLKLVEKQALRKELGIPERDYLVGICASLRSEKAHEDFISAVARLRSENIAASGLIIGDGPERVRIEATIRNAGMSEYINITGFRADVRPLIAICDAMTLVSHGVETFSLAALEAMSMSKPMVMSDIGGASEQIKPGVSGFLFPPGDIDALTRHLAVLSQEIERRKMGEEARRSVCESFTVEAMAKHYADTLAGLAKMQ